MRHLDRSLTGSIDPSPLRACRCDTAWTREIGIGAAIGWGAIVVCVLPMLLIGGIAVVITAPALRMGMACRRRLVFRPPDFGRGGRISWIRVSAFRCRGGLVRGCVRIRALLRHHPRHSAGFDQCEHRYFSCLQLPPDHRLLAYASTVVELGTELRLEGVPGAYFWAHRDGSQQPLTRLSRAIRWVRSG